MNLNEQEPTPISDYRIAYCAGYFDGEGCIHVSENSGTLRLHVLITSGDKNTLNLFKQLLGGNVLPRENTKDNRRQMFTWRVGGYGALDAMKQMVPFLIAKREQAQLVFDRGWNIHKRGYTLNATENFNRKAIMAGLKSMKKKGFVSYEPA